MTISINICGYGYVGGGMGSLCIKNDIEFNVYDLEKKDGNFNYFDNVSSMVKYSEINDINYYIIAVPTPSDIDGNCDISIVRKVLEELSVLISKETYVIIKSTLVPGTTLQLNNEYPKLNIVLSPEFLREKTYLDDIYNANFILLGIPLNFSMEKYQNILIVMRLFYKHNTEIDIFMKSYEECEIFKYTLNTYLATKITFFNEIYDLCESMNVDYQKLKTMFSLDTRIGNYGIHVPNDGKFSYSGKCLPKEVRAMIKLQEKQYLSTEFMKCVKKRGDDFNNKNQ